MIIICKKYISWIASYTRDPFWDKKTSDCFSFCLSCSEACHHSLAHKNQLGLYDECNKCNLKFYCLLLTN